MAKCGILDLIENGDNRETEALRLKSCCPEKERLLTFLHSSTVDSHRGGGNTTYCRVSNSC